MSGIEFLRIFRFHRLPESIVKGGWRYATNGYVGLRISDESADMEVPDASKPVIGKLEGWLGKSAEWPVKPLSVEYAIFGKRTCKVCPACKECNGEREIECGECGHFSPCSACGRSGNGKCTACNSTRSVPAVRWVFIDGHCFDAEALESVWNLDEFACFVDQNIWALKFTFEYNGDPGAGILMAMDGDPKDEE